MDGESRERDEPRGVRGDRRGHGNHPVGGVYGWATAEAFGDGRAAGCGKVRLVALSAEVRSADLNFSPEAVGVAFGEPEGAETGVGLDAGQGSQRRGR